MSMTAAEVRARRVGLGLTQGDIARLMAVEDRTVRRWEAGDAEPPADLRERLAYLLERRDDIARAWVVAGQPITLPADPDGLPPSLWWSAAGRALEVLDVAVTVERPAVATDGRARPRGTLTPEQVETARDLRAAGKSWRAVGAELGVNESTVRRTLGSDGARTGPRQVVDEDAVLRLHRTGMTQAGIAKQLGVSRGAVRRRLAEAGVTSWSTVRQPAYRRNQE